MYILVYLFVLMNFYRLLWMSMGIQGLLILDRQRMDFIYGWLFWSSYLLGGENASPLVSNFDPFLFYRASNFDLVSMVYWNCETELFFFFCWVWTRRDLKAMALNFLFFWVTSKLIACHYALNFTNAWSWVVTLKLLWQDPFYAILRLNCTVQLISLWPSKLPLAGPSWYFFQ